MIMDPESEARYLLAPTPEQLASVKVFPLILSLRREATVSEYYLPSFQFSFIFIMSDYNRYVKHYQS